MIEEMDTNMLTRFIIEHIYLLEKPFKIALRYEQSNLD
jgi:hypothetical protein